MRLTSRGKGWRVAPTFHAKGFAVDLEAEAALGDDTTASFAVDREGSARVQVTHEFDADTTFKVPARQREGGREGLVGGGGGIGI